MIVFRAMCNEEYERTIKLGCADFSKKRFKWFSNNINFILDRVGDGKFNNSKFKDNAYRNIVKYHVRNPSVLIRVSDNELMLRRKSQPLVGIEFVELL